MKKTLVVLLALMMVFAFATTAMAADEQYVPYNDIADQDVEIQTAIERLTILGALTGYDTEGTKFAPSQLITREEFATIGVRIAGLEDQVALYASMASAFTDVEEGRWSEGYINAANANGIMIGRGNGVFDPKANVTMQEVTTVLLRAVGYDDRLPGAWPSDYNTKAVNVGITEYVDYIGPKAATRGEVASLVNETLDLWTVQYVEDTTGLGQIIGGVIQWIDGVNIPVVDKDNYMYVIDATNEEGNYGTTLLNQTFNADVIANVLFNDGATLLSEAKAWGFEDFADWELEAYYGTNADDDLYDNTAEVTREFAALYGISKGQDVTDLGWQKADLTINADGEIMYVDLTSDIVRTADATAAQADDANDRKIGTALPETHYGEIWYDGNDAYAAKDYAAFSGRDYGIVDDVDEYEVYFRTDAPANDLNDIDLDDDAVFYLDGEGFIEAADLEAGDVVYQGVLQSGEYIYLVYRPVEATITDLNRLDIEVDDVVYAAVNDQSYFSYDQGGKFEAYQYQRILDLELDFTDSVAFVPAYAFGTFAYFADELQHSGAGILESYVISNGSRLDDTAARYVSGMYILFAGDDEPTLVEFSDEVLASALTGDYPVEGSYVEYIVDNDGVFVIDDATYTDDFTKVVELRNEAAKDVDGTWNASNSRLSLEGTGINDTYRFSENAVIYLVESNAAGDYIFDSAQTLTADEFIELGNFTGAEGLEIISTTNDITTITALYVHNANFIGDVAYGIGLYSDGRGVHDEVSRFYVAIDDERINVADDAADDVDTEIGTAPAIIAYKTVGGEIVSDDDVYVIADYNALAAGWMDTGSWNDDTGYELISGDIVSYNSGALIINNLYGSTEGTTETQFTLYNDNYVSGWDFNTNTELDLGDLHDDLVGKYVIVVYEPGDHNMIHLLVFDDAGANIHP